jgi:hypothetical protein
MNGQRVSLLHPHYPGGHSGLRMLQLESLLKPNLHQLCSFFSDLMSLYHGQM